MTVGKGYQSPIFREHLFEFLQRLEIVAVKTFGAGYFA